MSVVGKKALVVVTGASRGIGRSIAVALARDVAGPSSKFVLLGRNVEKLKETEELVKKEKEGLETKVVVRDDSKVLDEHAKSEEEVFAELEGRFDAAIIVHNSGSLGRQGARTQDLTPAEISSYFTSNLVSAAALNASFLNKTHNISTRLIVNVSSLMALEPLQTWSMYCSGKAARDMFFRVVAVENKEVRVLNYAPGPVLTDMVTSVILGDPATDPAIREWSGGKVKDGTYLKPEETAQKLIEVLKEDGFKSGQHVDYYDQVPKKE